jgi:Protein of unknown function (DUF1638)
VQGGPEQYATDSSNRALVIACGALAHEVAALRRANHWTALDVTCLPPELHNRPEDIPGAVQAEIHRAREGYARIFVAYADCGTGGRLDQVLRAEGVERLAGAHCYEFFAGSKIFAALAEAEPGTFYLTDFLLRHFERLVEQSLGIDRHPQLAQEYFRNYRRLVYLAQTQDPNAVDRARAIAQRYGFAFELVVTGLGGLEEALVSFMPRMQRAGT